MVCPFFVANIFHGKGWNQGTQGTWKNLGSANLSVVIVAVCLNELDSVCLNGWVGQGKASRM